MYPILRKRVYFPVFNDRTSGNHELSSCFSDGADYSLPAVNIIENEKHFQIQVATPGINKDDLKVNFDKNVLTVSSEHESKEEENMNFMRKEFNYKSFSRSFIIPETVNVDKIKASQENGILMIDLPKFDETKIKSNREIKVL